MSSQGRGVLIQTLPGLDVVFPAVPRACHDKAVKLSSREIGVLVFATYLGCEEFSTRFAEHRYMARDDGEPFEAWNAKVLDSSNANELKIAHAYCFNEPK